MNNRWGKEKRGIQADLILLSTSEPHGIAYIETKELDGETNLKTKSALEETKSMEDRLDSISRFNGEQSIRFLNLFLYSRRNHLRRPQQQAGQIPGLFFFSFFYFASLSSIRLWFMNHVEGQLNWNQRTTPITNDSILLRGCILKNTRWLAIHLALNWCKETQATTNAIKTIITTTTTTIFSGATVLWSSLVPKRS